MVVIFSLVLQQSERLLCIDCTNTWTPYHSLNPLLVPQHLFKTQCLTAIEWCLLAMQCNLSLVYKWGRHLLREACIQGSTVHIYIHTSIKMFLNKKHASRVGETSTETRQLTSDIPTYTVHVQHSVLLQANFKACMWNTPWQSLLKYSNMCSKWSGVVEVHWVVRVCWDVRC